MSKYVDLDNMLLSLIIANTSGFAIL